MQIEEKKKKVESMDDIVFENRNKEYGAYYLRTIYKKYVSQSLISAVIFLTLAIGIPFFVFKANYAKKAQVTVGVELGNFDQPEDEEIKPPPPPPPPPAEIKQLAESFRPPEITDDTTQVTKIQSTENLIAAVTNVAVEETGPLVVSDTKQPEVIEKAPEPIVDVMDVQEQPNFPGGDEERIKFIQGNVKYPQLAERENVQGTVWIQFVVEPDGTLSNFEVKRAPVPALGLDEEALRVAKAMPKWSSGKQNGKSCRVRMAMPIKFQLTN